MNRLVLKLIQSCNTVGLFPKRGHFELFSQPLTPDYADNNSNSMNKIIRPSEEKSPERS